MIASNWWLRGLLQLRSWWFGDRKVGGSIKAVSVVSTGYRLRRRIQQDTNEERWNNVHCVSRPQGRQLARNNEIGIDFRFHKPTVDHSTRLRNYCTSKPACPVEEIKISLLQWALHCLQLGFNFFNVPVAVNSRRCYVFLWHTNNSWEKHEPSWNPNFTK